MYKKIKISLAFFILLAFLPSLASAGYLRSELQISTKEYNQQNPHVIFLPDKELYFVTWEDWRNQLTSGADIYGMFLKADGTSCGNEFIISDSDSGGAPGNQTVPRAAYRDAGLTATGDDRIMVVWQDTRRTINESGFIYFRVIDVTDININSNCSGTSMGDQTPIAFEDDDPDDGIQSQATSRVMPKISYDVINDRFLIAWVESRTTRKTSKFRPFPLNPTEPSWVFGDTQFVGYTGIKGIDLSYQINHPTIITQFMDPLSDIADTFTRARLITRNSSAMQVVSEYEFFDNISNVDISCDSTTPECLFVWEGVKGKFTRTDICENNFDTDTDKVCDDNDIVSSTATVEYNPTNKEIFGIFEKNIPLSVVHSLRISHSGIGAFYPSIGFDPITKRFLTAWEDRRDGLNTKIYGQIIYSGSGLYNNNFIISFQDTNGDGQQDPNVANSRQTQPFVSYDAVNQRYFVAWQDGRNSDLSLENLDIYGQKVDAEGSLRGNNYAIYNLPFNQFAPVIANNPIMDEFLAIWKDARNTDKKTCGTGTQPCGSDVFGQLFTLGQPAITLLKPDNTHLAPPLLQNFQNPAGSGSVEVGLSATQSFKIRNTGDEVLKIDFIDTTCGVSMSPFYFDGLPAELEAPGGGTIDLVPSAELTLIVRFAPTAAGSYNRCFVIVSNAGRQTVNLSALAGIGRVLGQQRINVSPTAIDFGIINTGDIKTETITITNDGESPLLIRSIGRPKKAFRVASDRCSNQTLSAGSSCEVKVSFSSQFRGRFRSSLVIRSNDPARPTVRVGLRGASKF